ncbi:MAG: transposase, partial [Betaproteobacteria bacterium]
NCMIRSAVRAGLHNQFCMPLWHCLGQAFGLPAEPAGQKVVADCWGRWPAIAQAWRRQWPQVIPFFAYPHEVRLIIYTTNAIESLHMQVRKIVKSRGHFPNDEAARKLLFLALRNVAKRWTMPHRFWRPAANQFAIMFGDRFTHADAAL